MQKTVNMNYIETIYGLAKQCIHLKCYEEAQEWIEKELIAHGAMKNIIK